jgi:hypothetical protein
VKRFKYDRFLAISGRVIVGNEIVRPHSREAYRMGDRLLTANVAAIMFLASGVGTSPAQELGAPASPGTFHLAEAT